MKSVAYEHSPVRSFMTGERIHTFQLDSEKTLWEQRDKIKWGTYGKHRSHSLKFKKTVDLTTEHLQNILKTEMYWLPEWYEWFIKEILKERTAVPDELFEIS